MLKKGEIDKKWKVADAACSSFCVCTVSVCVSWIRLKRRLICQIKLKRIACFIEGSGRRVQAKKGKMSTYL